MSENHLHRFVQIASALLSFRMARNVLAYHPLQAYTKLPLLLILPQVHFERRSSGTHSYRLQNYELPPELKPLNAMHSDDLVVFVCDTE
jgi:hypothetical protein